MEGATRREFLKAALLATGTACNGRGQEPSSRIVIARDDKLRGVGSAFDASVILNTLDRALQTFYVCDTPVEAWRRVVRPAEVIGLKVNCLSGRGNSTSRPLVEAICERLQQAGVRDIVIWDRLNADLENAGYKFHPEYLSTNLPPYPRRDAGACQSHCRRRGAALRLHRKCTRASGREYLLPGVPPRRGQTLRLRPGGNSDPERRLPLLPPPHSRSLEVEPVRKQPPLFMKHPQQSTSGRKWRALTDFSQDFRKIRLHQAIKYGIKAH